MLRIYVFLALIFPSVINAGPLYDHLFVNTQDGGASDPKGRASGYLMALITDQNLNVGICLYITSELLVHLWEGPRVHEGREQVNQLTADLYSFREEILKIDRRRVDALKTNSILERFKAYLAIVNADILTEKVVLTPTIYNGLGLKDMVVHLRQEYQIYNEYCPDLVPETVEEMEDQFLFKFFRNVLAQLRIIEESTDLSKMCDYLDYLSSLIDNDIPFLENYRYAYFNEAIELSLKIDEYKGLRNVSKSRFLDKVARISDLVEKIIQDLRLKKHREIDKLVGEFDAGVDRSPPASLFTEGQVGRGTSTSTSLWSWITGK